MPGGDGHRGKSLKLLEKIPEDAEATVVLVGEEAGSWVCVLPPCSARPQLWPAGQAPSASLPFLTACLASSLRFPSPLPASHPVFCYLGLLLVHRALL